MAASAVAVPVRPAAAAAAVWPRRTPDARHCLGRFRCAQARPVPPAASAPLRTVEAVLACLTEDGTVLTYAHVHVPQTTTYTCQPLTFAVAYA